MSLGLDIIGNNLVEIDHALKVEHTLVANWSGTKVYDASVGWGRLWRWFYAIAGLVRLDYRDVKLADAMQKTHQAFKERVELLKVHVKNYKKFLTQVCNEYSFDEEEAFTSRKSLSSWSERIIVLLSIREDLQVDKINKIFESSVGKELLTQEEETLFSEVTHFQQLINLEGQIYYPTPWASLSRVSTDRKLSAEQTKALDRWISKLNSAGQRITVRELHRALLALVMHINDSTSAEGVAKADIALLEWKLKGKGCHIITACDTAHLRWRAQLSPGDIITCNGKEIVLGEKLEGQFDEPLQYYAIQNDNSKVVIIAQSEAYLGIYCRQEMEEGWGLKTAEIFEIDGGGQCAIQERLGPSFNNCEWKSQTFRLLEDEAKKIKPIEVLIKKLCEQNYTPIPFSPDNIRWDRKGNLKSTKSLIKGKFDFSQMEGFVAACAAGNRYIYQHLMKHSGLATHPTSRFYRKMLADALSGRKINVEEEAALHKVIDPRCIDRAIELRVDALRIKTRCCDRILELYNVTSGRESLEQLIADQLLTRLEEGETIGLQENSLTEELMDSILRFKRFKLKDEILQSRVKAICEKVDGRSGRNQLLHDKEFYYSYGIYHSQQVNDVMVDMIALYSHV